MMSNKLPILAIGLIAMVALAGCKGGGGGAVGSLFGEDGIFNFGGSSGGGETIEIASLPAGESSGSTSSGSSSSGPSSGSGLAHQPEPATFALLGSGLLAYALYRRKKRS